MSQSKELAINNSEQRFSLPGLNLELDNFINISKDGIRHTAQMCYNSVIDGEVDAIDALIFTKKAADLFKEMEAKIRPVAESKPIGKDFAKFGCKIDEAMTGVSYDFSNCGDPVYNEILAEFDKSKELLEERKTFLKSVTKPMDIVINEAEVYTIQPPVKSGKLGLKITIK